MLLAYMYVVKTSETPQYSAVQYNTFANYNLIISILVNEYLSDSVN